MENYKAEDFRVDCETIYSGGFCIKPTYKVTVTHIPTGISVTESEARSQHANRNTAFTKLQEKLDSMKNNENVFGELFDKIDSAISEVTKSKSENTIKVSTLEYVDFNDIEEFICKELGIERKYFRDYHKVIGGKYKDLWHVWLKLVGSEIDNGGYHLTCLSSLMDSYYYEQTLKSYGNWIECLRKPLEKLQDQLGDDIVVYYSW